jgi:solute carrier family 25 protein 39/40
MSETQETEELVQQGTNISKGFDPVQKTLAATGGALVNSVVLTPFDVWKMRSQVAGAKRREAMAASAKTGTQVVVEPLPKFSLTTFVKEEGVLALWRGLRPTLWMALPSSGLYFTSYEYVKEVLQRECDMDIGAPLIAGSLARVFSAIAVSPLELARTNLQAITRVRATGGANMPKQTVFHMLQQTVRSRGVSSLWTGLGPTILRDVPFSAIYWGAYEVIKRQLEPKYFKDGDVRVAFGAGAVSGLLAAGITNPLDVVKSRTQAQIMATSETGTAWVITKRICVEEGWRGFAAGIAPRCAKVAPACAIMISTYEALKAFLA